MGILTVFLDKCTDLKDEDLIGKSDPYIKFDLEQDNLILDKKYGSMTSSKKRDTLNPVWGETFHFTIPTLKNMVLTCLVMDDDIISDDKLGKCKIKLDRLDLTTYPTEITKKVDNKVFRKDAFIYLKISYAE
jgi:Ca2+-dependent lipid-binding protein